MIIHYCVNVVILLFASVVATNVILLIFVSRRFIVKF